MSLPARPCPAVHQPPARALTTPALQRGAHALALAALLGLGACASTQWQAQGERLARPLCEAGGPTDTAAILWAPAWRPDQKEPARREALAEQGLALFQAQAQGPAPASCLAISRIERRAELSSPDRPDPAALRASLGTSVGSSTGEAPRYLILLRLRELGPRLSLGLPVGVEGGTEVVVDLRVHDQRQQLWLAEQQLRRWHGGNFYVKGVDGLPADLADTLRAALLAPASTRGAR
ncbi:MAG: hypothetical protein RL722_1843 [Pseudomonadota bacterium]|jgi:hypothetical protein